MGEPRSAIGVTGELPLRDQMPNLSPQWLILHWIILGDPGAVSGGGKKSKRARKKFGRREVKNDEKSPWGQVLNGPVPNGRGSSGF